VNVDPGYLTQTLGNPWQFDYQNCDDDWWPASRPISLESDGLPPLPKMHYRWHSTRLTMPAPFGDDPVIHRWKEMGYIKLDSGWRVIEDERVADKDLYNPLAP
jgi:hypothetical protein